MTEAVIRKALTIDDFDLPEFMIKAADAGEITKAEAGELLNRRVAKQRLPAESFAQAYDRLLARGEDHAGAEIFRKYMRMRGPDEGQVAAQKAIDAPRAAPSSSGSNNMAKLECMASDVRKAQPHLTKEQAFSKALQTPEGIALYKADKLERLGVV